MKPAALLIAVSAILLLTSPSAASEEDCVLFGSCTAVPNMDAPQYGLWSYTLVVEWETAQHGISHIDMIVDDGENCSAEDLLAGVIFPDVAGEAAGEPAGCIVELTSELEMRGDPSIPGVTVPVFKFEYEEDGCELTELGSATLVFYSDYPPYPIAEDNLFLVDKFARDYCWGALDGEFPALPCSPVTAVQESWSRIKASYSD